YASGDFRGPDYPEVLKRLKEHCNVDLSADLLGHLQGLQARRKRLEHFQINEGRDEVLSSAAQVAGDILQFVGSHLEPDGLDGSAPTLIKQIREELNKSVLVLEVHLEPVIAKLEADRIEALECPRCHQETLALAEPVGCRFC